MPLACTRRSRAATWPTEEPADALVSVQRREAIAGLELAVLAHGHAERHVARHTRRPSRFRPRSSIFGNAARVGIPAMLAVGPDDGSRCSASSVANAPTNSERGQAPEAAVLTLLPLSNSGAWPVRAGGTPRRRLRRSRLGAHGKPGRRGVRSATWLPRGRRESVASRSVGRRILRP
jgi:hypothetical protein